MKTLIVECKFVIEIPWDHEPQYSTDEHIRFRIEENSCPGTGSVGSALDDLMSIADENSICWACAVGGENKLLAIEDREPRNYADQITFKTKTLTVKCKSCGADVSEVIKENASIAMSKLHCPHCNYTTTSMDIGCR